MKTGVALFALLGWGLGATTAAAQVPDLLVSISAEEEQQQFAANEYFVRKNGYSSSRSRIARLNVDALLDKNERIRIELFDDVSLEFETIDLDITNGGVNFAWSGRNVATPYSRAEFADLVSTNNPTKPAGIGDVIYDQIFELTIHGTQYVYDKTPSDAEGVAGQRKDAETGRFIDERERLADVIARGTTFYSTQFNVQYWGSFSSASSPSLASTDVPIYFEVVPLPNDRRYVVMYQTDPTKTVPMADSYSRLTPSQEKRVREYENFLRSLGPDPSKAKMQREEE